MSAGAAPLTPDSSFTHRGGAAQPPESSDQRDLQRPHSAPGAGAGAGQAVRRDPAFYSALRRAQSECVSPKCPDTL